MRLSPGGDPVDFGRGLDYVLSRFDERIAELEAEERATEAARKEEARKRAEEDREKIALAAEEAKKEITATLLKYSGVPERYHSATLAGWSPDAPKPEDFETQTRIKPKLLAWAGSLDIAGATSEVWIGPAGTGKTHLACGMLMDRFAVGKDGFYVTAKGYTDKIKNSYRQDSKESSTDILERYASVPVLVLDEVGRQFEAKSEEIYFFELINERYNNRRPTLFLSNLSDEEFRAFVGTAVMDRLKEGGGRFLPFNWESRRK